MKKEEPGSGKNFEENFREHLEKAIEEYSPEQNKGVDEVNLPEGTVLSKEGLVQLQKNPSRIKGGEFKVDLVLNAKNCIYGRLASRVAQRCLDGWKIAVVNSGESVITGSEKDIESEFRKKAKIGGNKGPIHPKKPHRIFKKSVRGMLPTEKERGRKAFENFRIYEENPYEIEGATIGKTIEDISTKRYVYLSDVCSEI